MNKKASLLFGVTLIALGILALAANLLIRAAGGGLLLGFRAWPIFVVAVGLLFCIPPFLFPGQRGLGGLFIPGMPVLTTGVILFVCSVTSQWHWWAYLWPLEVISVALGFVLAAVFLRVVWLMIPASIVGLIGLVLQFCAVTGLWGSWAVLWTVVPFAVGLPLLLIGMFKKIEGVKLAGIILCGFAGLCFAAMSSILVTSLWITRIIGPAIVLGLGVLMVISALYKPAATAAAMPVPAPVAPATEKPAATPSPKGKPAKAAKK
jgi:hypothetical protein